MADEEDAELMEALQIVSHRKGKGKGKGKKGKKETFPTNSASASSVPSVANTELPFKLQAQGSFKLGQERQKRLAAMKQKTRCSTCG
eukprot:10854-Amphidinium_carterae.1